MNFALVAIFVTPAVLPLAGRLVKVHAVAQDSSQTGSSICRENGGGGNRTRVSGQPETALSRENKRGRPGRRSLRYYDPNFYTRERLSRQKAATHEVPVGLWVFTPVLADPADVVLDDLAAHTLWRLASEVLPARSWMVLRARYEDEQTHEEIGRSLWLTRERIRQILYETEKRLRDVVGVE